MASHFRNDVDESISTINITPFVDIILVVLIIFMIATPVIMNSGIKVNLPQAASGDPNPPSQMNVSITNSGALYLNGKESSEEQIGQTATELLKKNPEAQAIISADKEVAHGQVIKILDLVKSAGIKKFAISIEKK